MFLIKFSTLLMAVLSAGNLCAEASGETATSPSLHPLGPSAGDGGASASTWSRVLRFARSGKHEVADVYDHLGAMVSVPHTYCHGNHCDYYRQPLEFICAHRDHLDLVGALKGASSSSTPLTLNPSTLSSIVEGRVRNSSRIAAKASQGKGPEQQQQQQYMSKEDARKVLRGQKQVLPSNPTVASDTHGPPVPVDASLIPSPSSILRLLGAESSIFAAIAQGSNANYNNSSYHNNSAVQVDFQGEMMASIKSFATRKRYFPLTEEELNEAVRYDLHVRRGSRHLSPLSTEEEKERIAHLVTLAGEWDAQWQSAVLARIPNRNLDDSGAVAANVPETKNTQQGGNGGVDGDAEESVVDDALRAADAIRKSYRVGHPLHILRMVSHTSGGTYGSSGNRKMARLLKKRGLDEAATLLKGEKEVIDAVRNPSTLEPTAAGNSGGPRASPNKYALPLDLAVSMDDWFCAARRPALLEPAFAVEDIHIICAPSHLVDDSGVFDKANRRVSTAAAKEEEERWYTFLTASFPRYVWGGVGAGSAQSDYVEWHHRPAAATGSDSAYRGGGAYNNVTIPHHCALHYHIVNYGEPHAYLGVVLLALTTVAFVIVMLFFVGGRWYQASIASFKTHQALKRLDAECKARQRKREEEALGPRDADGDEGGGGGDDGGDESAPFELPPDISAVNAFGVANGRARADEDRGSRGAVDPAILKAIREHDAAERDRLMDPLERHYDPASHRRGEMMGGAAHAVGGGDGGVRRRRVAALDSAAVVDSVRRASFHSHHWDPVIMGGSSPMLATSTTASSRFQQQQLQQLQGANAGGALYANPHNLTLGDLMGYNNNNGAAAAQRDAASASNGRNLRGGLSFDVSDLSSLQMPLDIGVTPRKIPSPKTWLKSDTIPEVVQTIAIDEY